MDLDLKDYIRRQTENTAKIVELQTRDDNGKLFVERPLVGRVKQYVDNFLERPKSSRRWIVIPGLRGVGKTVAMIQVLGYVRKVLTDRKIKTTINPIYIPLDKVVNNLRCDISEVVKILESLAGVDFINLNQPLFLFIDEIQVDSRWSKTLKSVYDSSPMIFMCCSGSSATQLQMGADVAGRRATVERMHPLSFSEYCYIKNGLEIEKNLAAKLKKVLYDSKDAESVYKELRSLKGVLEEVWRKYKDFSVKEYLQFGTLLSTIEMTDADEAVSHLSATLDSMVIKDLVGDGIDLYSATKLLPLLAASGDVFSLPKMCDLVGAKRQAMEKILQSCTRAELLIKVPAHGNQYNAARLPTRYLFMSPVLRYIYSKEIYLSNRGLLLEDLAGLHYYREFIATGKGYLTHPYTKKPDIKCDFILETFQGFKKIALEFGMGKKSGLQVVKTMEKTKCDYGLIFSKQGLRLNEAKNAVNVPLEYFYLI